MKSAFALALGALTLIGIAGFLWLRPHDSPVARDAVVVAEESPPVAQTPATAPAAEEVNPFIPNYEKEYVDLSRFCGHRPACVNDPHSPNNERELRWMQQHGYPTKDELERLARLSEVELEEEAKRGSLTAMTELGGRMVERNDPKGSLWFMRAADRGSIYAYYAESKTEMNRTLGHGLVESGAFLRVAYMLGDHKAATELYRFKEKEKLGIGEMVAIDRRAASLYLTYAKKRQPSPRPLE